MVRFIYQRRKGHYTKHMRIAVCDDNQDDIRRISELLYSYNDSFQIMEYTNGEFLVADCLEHEFLFDVIFLDIYMQEINGIEIATKIRAAMRNVIIIFVSSSNEHYPEAFHVFAFNYIIKPINSNILKLVLDQALTKIDAEPGQQIQFNYKNKNYRILCKDILYLESRDKTILLHMNDKTILQCYAKLDDFLKQLPVEFFIRCHQSFIVNIYHIKEMSKDHFRIGSAAINISKKYQKTAKDVYFEYLFKHMSN